MKNVLRWIAPIVAFGFAAVLVRSSLDRVEAAEIGLTGGTRAEFVQSSIASCVRRQITAPENKGIAGPILDEYCKCYSNALADRVTNNELNKYAAMDQAAVAVIIEPKINEAAAPCLKDIGKQIAR